MEFLKYADLDDNRTPTYKLATQLNLKTQELYNTYRRFNELEKALTAELQRCGSISLERWTNILNAVNTTNKPIAEILREV